MWQNKNVTEFNEGYQSKVVEIFELCIKKETQTDSECLQQKEQHLFLSPFPALYRVRDILALNVMF